MPDTSRVQSPTVKVNGTALAAETYNDLVELRVEQSVHMPAAFSLRFRDPDFVLLDRRLFKVADTIEILLPTAANRDLSVFTGETTAIALDQGPGDRHELVISGLDGAHRLAQATRIRSFQNQSYADVATTIANENGLTPAVDAGSWASKPVEYLLQTGTDYAYLSELAARAGLAWWVEDGKLKVTKPATASPVTLTWRQNLSRFKVRFSAAEQADSVTVQGWDPAQQKAIKADDGGLLSGAAAADTGADAPFATTGHTEAAKLQGRKGGLTTAGLAVASAEEATAVAAALAARVVSSEVVAKGEALGTPELKAGGAVTVAGMGDSVSGTYRLTSVEHVFGVGKALATRFVAGGRTPASLADLVSLPVADPLAGGASGRGGSGWGRGLVIGVVTNNADPNNQGRVRVRFPTLSASDEGAWARVAIVGGGTTRGMAWLPEIDDEVIVGFDSGDLRFPVVLGGLWSAKNKPPDPKGGALVAGGKVARRVLASRVGHQLELGDGDGPDQRHIALALADGKTKLRLGEDKVDIESPSGNPVTIRSGSTTIVVTSNGDVTVEGGSVSLKGRQKLTLQAPNVEISADSSLKVTSSGQLELGGAMAKVQASGILELKGSLTKIN